MQENYLYEYAVVRIVPLVEREEFLNVGVILYCPKKGFLKVRYHLDEARLKAFSCSLEVSELAAYLHTLERICMGGKNGGPIGMLPIASRFRWLTATRSTIIQTSKIHPGFCIEPEETLDRLYEQLVL
ncbi:DUF3037 domain-containing protein [Emticicia sp. BO119]|uniref:DUF3037 domain-containing protein n=1 Tax=Emticicia sp. BO119 TaxID=2757768 RepID=UPI0015F06487|nr:DUF3037 domain-containing protein [Emticicia sp. BO119]MBA4852117.1 DUF3037 domain-containing protein [Emticicia sp. BO119]